MRGLIFILLSVSMGAFARVDFDVPIVQVESQKEFQFSVITQDYKITFKPGDYSWGTRMFAEYKTPKLAQLEDYAVVQFIRGCQFYSQEVGGEVYNRFDIYREFFNGLIPYKHSKWQIDSVDMDPMYNNTPEGFEGWGTRHGLYRWTTDGSFDEKKEVLFYKKRPLDSRLFVIDHPGTAFFNLNRAKNVSLEFKTCLYRTKDIPLVSGPDDLSFAKPLTCFDWSSSYVYNHKKGAFDRPKSVVPQCLD